MLAKICILSTCVKWPMKYSISVLMFLKLYPFLKNVNKYLFKNNFKTFFQNPVFGIFSFEVLDFKSFHLLTCGMKAFRIVSFRVRTQTQVEELTHSPSILVKSIH